MQIKTLVGKVHLHVQPDYASLPLEAVASNTAQRRAASLKRLVETPKVRPPEAGCVWL